MSDLKYKFIGKFDVVSGEVVVSDPCYDLPDKMTCPDLSGVLAVKNGEWRVTTINSDEGEWGNRVAYLLCRHEDNLFDDPYDFRLQPAEFDVAVDSGQAGVFDKQYFKDDSIVAGVERLYEGEVICEDEPWYSICCDRTCSEEGAGVIPYGGLSSSGYGDGCYKCSVIKEVDLTEGEKVVGILIDFYLDEKEDEYGEEDY